MVRVIVKKSLGLEKLYRCDVCGVETPLAYRVVLRSLSGVKFRGVVCYRCRKRLEIEDRRLQILHLIDVLNKIRGKVEKQKSVRMTYPIVMFTRDGGHIVWLKRRFEEMGFVIEKNSHVCLALAKDDLGKIDEVIGELEREAEKLEQMKENV